MTKYPHVCTNCDVSVLPAYSGVATLILSISNKFYAILISPKVVGDFSCCSA